MLLAVLLSGTVLPGCSATVQRNDWSVYEGPGAQYFQKQEYELPQVSDPLEPVNRIFWAFNDVVLLRVVYPVSTVWRFLVPQPVRTHLVMAAKNIEYPIYGINNVLQGRFKEAGDESLRFLINTTVGVLGLFDPASEWGIRPARTDTGFTFGHWGWDDRTFLNLPVVGPRTTRDSIGWVADRFMDPTMYFFPAGPIKGFIVGSERLEGYNRFVRTNLDAYTQSRFLGVLGRQVLSADFQPLSAGREEGAATQTLQAVFTDLQNPWFPFKSKTRRVRLPSTGRKLTYELWLQPQAAPVAFILPGMGAHRRSKLTVTFAESLYNQGFSVVSISSPMNFEFMQDAATVTVPGLPPSDARDVHVALDAIHGDLQCKYPERVTARLLVGQSLGGLLALHIAADQNEPDNALVPFERIVAINPPVDLGDAADKLDAMYNTPLRFAEDHRDDQVAYILQKAIRAGFGLDPRASTEVTFSEIEAEMLIGLSYRMTLHDVIWCSQQRYDMGVLKTPRHALRHGPASQEILDFSFMEYFYAFVLPYYQQRGEPSLSSEQLFAMADLRSVAQRLRAVDNVRVFCNSNDFLLDAEDIRWLADTVGDAHVTAFERGGHMGNLYEAEFQEVLARCLQDLLPAGATD